jgi:hypothetical protein
MKVHELINVLNHLPSDAEIDDPGVARGADGRFFSVKENHEKIKANPGQQHTVIATAAKNENI